MGTQNEDKNEINFEKAQSVIRDYVHLRDTVRILAVVMMILGIISIVFSVHFIGVAFNADGDLLYTEANIFRIIIVGVMVLFGIALAGFGAVLFFPLLYNRSKDIKIIHAVHNSIVRKSYFIHFELTSPVGDTKLEKLVNHLELVFPELRKNRRRHKKIIKQFKKEQKSSKETESLDNYDMVTHTYMERFAIKIFNRTVTLTDIETISKQLNKRNMVHKWFANNVERERVIILSNSYDDVFNEPDLDQKLDDIERDFKLNLILEEDEHGYAIVHLDY